MVDTDTEDFGHLAPLDADSVPNANQSHYCFSCEEPMTGLYCAQCGQRNDDFRRSIFSLIKELLASITALESRIWRTWAALLFMPGKVAREFSDGRRTYWSSPIRVYLAISIILFGFMNITQTQIFSVDVDVQVKDGISKPVKDLVADDLSITVAPHFFSTQKAVDRRNADSNFDLINIKLSNGIDFDIIEDEDEDNLEDGSEIEAATPPDTSPSDTSASDTSPSADIEDDVNNIIINGQAIAESRIADFFIRFIKDPNILNTVFRRDLPRLMFFMMPLTMLIGAVFIRGRGNALLYDHLIHTAYIHAVTFLLIFAGILLSKIIPGGTVINFIAIGLLLYLPLSLRRMFKRGWVKTLWTAYGVGFIYLLTLFVILVTLLARQLSKEFIS